MFAFRNQPLKTLYLLYSIPSILVRLPYWILAACVPAARPIQAWPFTRTLAFRGARAFIDIIYNIGFLSPEGDPAKDSIRPEKSGFVWVDPVPEAMIVGEVAELARANNVEPATVSGYWYGARDLQGGFGWPAAEGERVLYYLHGGGHVMGSGAPSSTAANAPRGVLQTCGDTVQRAFALEYRLASSSPFRAANPFPAALLDAVAGYRYLTESCGFVPKNIIVSGDSSGGQLAIALARYLCEAKLETLPKPGSLLLISPTVDWGLTHYGPESTLVTNASTDVVGPIMLNGYSARSLRGDLPEEALQTNAWLSPGSTRLPVSKGLFHGLPATLIIASSSEQTVDAMRTFRDRLIGDVGEGFVRYIEYPHAFHDFILFTWHEPERAQALGEISVWLRLVHPDGVVEM